MYAVTSDDVRHAEALGELYFQRFIKSVNKDLRQTLLSAAHLGLMQAAQIYDPSKCKIFFGFAYKFIQWRVLDEFRFFMWSKSQGRRVDCLQFNPDVHGSSVDMDIMSKMMLEKVRAFDPVSFDYFAGHATATAAGAAHGVSKTWATRKFQRYMERVKNEF